MKRLLLTLATFTVLSTHAQKTRNESAARKFSFGLVLSPDFAYRTLKNNGGGTNADLVINSRNQMEIGKLGYTCGLAFSVNVTKRLSFETGLQYSKKGYQTKKRDLVYSPPDPALPVRARFIYNYKYIDVPFKLDFVLREGRLRFIAGAGFAINFLVNADQKSIFEYSNGNIKRTKQSPAFDFKKFNLSPMISLGLGYRINDHLYLSIEPTFRYGILKITDTPVTEYLWNAGLNTGIHYTLRKRR